MNRHRSHPVLLEKLKTNGVEPGFIYRNDWSPDDTRNFMADIWSPANQASLDEFVDQTPSLRAKRDGNPPATRRELAMAAGRAHPCGMAAVAERILERHDKLHDVERVCPKVVDERRLAHDLLVMYAQLALDLGLYLGLYLFKFHSVYYII